MIAGVGPRPPRRPTSSDSSPSSRRRPSTSSWPPSVPRSQADLRDRAGDLPPAPRSTWGSTPGTRSSTSGPGPTSSSPARLRRAIDSLEDRPRRRPTRTRDPVFAAWHAFAALPAAEFAAKAAEVALAPAEPDARIDAHRRSPAGRSRDVAARLCRPGRRRRYGRRCWPRPSRSACAAKPRSSARRSSIPAGSRSGRSLYAERRAAAPSRRRRSAAAARPGRAEQARGDLSKKVARARTSTHPGSPAAGDGRERRAEPGQPARLRPGQPGPAGQGRPPAVPRGPLGARPQAVRRGERPARAGPGDRQPGQPADGPGAGQPGLAAPLRRRPGRHAQRLRPAERAAIAPRAARLPGRRVRPRRLVDQGAAPPDHALEHLPAAERRRPEAAASATRRTACSGRSTAAGSTSRRCATRSWPSRGARRRRWGAVRSPIERAPVLDPADRLRVHRPPEPRRRVPHVRLRQPRHLAARSGS